MKLTIALCTMNRAVPLRQCIAALTQQHGWISSIIVVEDVTHQQTYSLEELKSQFVHAPHVRCYYQTVSFYNIARSREFLFNQVKEDLLLFLDDDVIVGKDSLQKVHSFFRARPHAGLLTGVMWPVEKGNSFSQIDCLYFNQGFLSLGRNQLMDMCPFSFVALNLSELQKRKVRISFDPQFSAGEDIDFSLRLSQQGVPLCFDARIVNFHLFDTSLKGYLRKKYEHGHLIYLLFTKHQSRYRSSQELIAPHDPFSAFLWLMRSARHSTRYYVLLGRFSLLEELLIFTGEVFSLLGCMRQRVLFSRLNK